MQSTIAQHEAGELTLYPDVAEREAQAAERLARIEEMDPEQQSLALAFLVGYHPAALDAALEAAEPDGEGAPLPEEEMEPFCRTCKAPVGLFPSHGLEYRHYVRATATREARQYGADHQLVLGWRYLSDIPYPGI